jgi:hypothetical protein
VGVRVAMHVEHFEDAIPQLREAFLSSGYSSLISVDGHSGSGKSCFAKLICAALDGGHLQLDECLLPAHDRGSEYRDMIDYEKLERRRATLTAAKELLVVDGLCLEWIVPQIVHNSFRVYMQRDGIITSMGEQRRRSKFGTNRYHDECAPAAAAHFIISSPGL